MKNDLPFISVIVTTYNRKELLEETIDSILNQTYKNFELIVVDNCSDYDFFSYIKSLNDNRIKAYQNQNDGVIAINRNYGIKKSVGKFIAFCDDDDLWYPNKLEKQLKLFTEPSIVGIGSYTENVGNTKLFKDKGKNKDKNLVLLSLEDIIKGKSVALSSLIVKTNNIRFPEEKGLIYVEDWDYQIQLTMNGAKIALYDTLVKYRIPPFYDSYPEKASNSINVINKYKNYYTKDEYKKKLYDYNWYMGLRFLKVGNRPQARSYLKKSLIHKKGFKSYMGIVFTLLPRYLLNGLLELYYINR